MGELKEKLASRMSLKKLGRFVDRENLLCGNVTAELLTILQNSLMILGTIQDEAVFNIAYRNNTMEAKSRGGFIIGVSDENNEVCREWIEIPKVEEFFYPLVSVVPLQLLAYQLAISQGKDPNRPRNLAKSVTVK